MVSYSLVAEEPPRVTLSPIGPANARLTIRPRLTSPFVLQASSSAPIVLLLHLIVFGPVALVLAILQPTLPTLPSPRFSWNASTLEP